MAQGSKGTGRSKDSESSPPHILGGGPYALPPPPPQKKNIATRNNIRIKAFFATFVYSIF